ncbi:MAG: SusC/RagA family TonB-linked outer membrane protein, partial [Sphingobacterium sp.]
MKSIRIKLCYFFTTLFLLAVVTESSAQTRISGNVVDEQGNPIEGVNVKIKGQQAVTTSTVNGAFTIIVNDPSAILTFSFLGFEPKEVVANAQEVKRVTLVSTISKLDEVVVIGYGETTVGDLTGSVSSIKGGELVKTAATSFGEALQGRLAGVRVNMQSGEPGSSVNIQIRGSNSINASNSPLYVIDGMQMDVNEGEVASSSVGGYSTYNPLASINPNDIESIVVLKDASATAIYGARGANGVILITTKTGHSERTRINLDASFGLSEVPNKLKMLGPQDYLDYRFNFGSSSYSWGQDLDENGVADIPFNADDYDTFNWQDLLLRNGLTRKYNLSVEQGNKKTNFKFGIGHDKQGGVVESNDYERLSANMKVNHTVSDKLDLGMNVNYGRTTTDGAVSSGGGAGSFSGLIQSMYTESPVGIYVPQENEGIGRYIPLTSMFFDSYKNVTFDNLFGNLFAQYEIIPGLKLRVSGSGRTSFSKMQEFYGKETRWGSVNDGRAGLQDVRTTSFTQSNTLTYTKQVAQRYLTAMLGQETNGYKSENSSIRAYSFEDESTGVFDISKGNVVDKPTTYLYKLNRLSYFGRVNYNINYKYYFTASFRADGSSNFGSGNRFGYFPSGAFSWKINNEKFLKNVDAISNLKLRVSYGLTGNDRISSYAALSRLGINNYAGNGSPIFGMAPTQSPNPDLKWESTAQTDIGIDLGLFNERITLTADVYKKITDDLLLNTPIPSQTGFSKQWQNIGSVENKGFELSINSVNIDKK